ILRHRYSVHYTLSLHDALPIWVKYDQLRRLRLEQGCENGADDNSACRYCSQREHGGYENLGDKTHAASAVVAMVANNGRGVSHGKPPFWLTSCLLSMCLTLTHDVIFRHTLGRPPLKKGNRGRKITKNYGNTLLWNM